MPLMKRVTNKLRASGIDLEIHRGLYGYCATDPRLRKQRSTPVRDTVCEVVADISAGIRPVKESN